MIDAFEDRSARRAAALAALLVGGPGCIGWPRVETSTRNEDRPVRSYEEVEVSPEARVLPGVTLDRGVDGQPERVRIEAVRERECTRIAHRVVDRTTVHERDVTSPAVWYAGYILGSVGVSAVTTGSVLIATDNLGPDGLVFAVTTMGHLLTFNMVSVLAAQARAADSTEHVGIVDEVSRTSERCRREPVRGAAVRIVARNGEALLTGVTDPGGRFEALIDIGRALDLGADYTVQIDGVVVGGLRIEVSGAVQKR